MGVDGELGLPLRLLRLVSLGGIRSTAELGQELGISQALVTMMVEDLRRRDYLQAVSVGECASSCTSCGIANACKLPGATEQLLLLILTEKGKLAAPAATPRRA